MTDSLRIIDPVTGAVMFDSDTEPQESYADDLPYIVRGGTLERSWTLQTSVQLENELKLTEPTCIACGSLVLTLDNGMWTCQICGSTWKAS